RAITVDGTGIVHCGPGLRNVRRILTAFGREGIPFACGRDDAGPDGTPFPDEWRASADDMYGIVLPPVIGVTFPLPGETLLAEAISGSDEPVMIVALGPWTTLQDLFAARPELATRVAGIHAMAGAFDVPGNMTIAAITPRDGIEWNVGADPDSYADVLALDIPVALVPLDATNDVPVPADVLARLEADHTAAGADIAYETYARAPYLATEGNYWWDATAAVALAQPSLLTWEDASIAISEAGRLTRDADGRPARIATGADTAATQDAILAGLRRGDARPVPFAAAGRVTATWNGTTCVLDTSEAPARAGLTRVEIVNETDGPVGMLGAGVRPPMTWPEAVAWASTLDLSATPTMPDWLVELEGESPFLEGRGTAMALVELPAGTVGFMCGTGAWPDIEFTDAGSIELSE
ncbi:MAG TPA: nucleoside hydrolase, partial [Candidatus Limnocylindrales bacterium]|nr:nucleoside hydrolase [Candidatus Limnocylindrales bacterium]